MPPPLQRPRQMCVLGCLERAAEGASVAYIDTEKKFSGRR